MLREIDKLADRITELEAALHPAFMILDGLRLAVEWELAPPIKG